MTEHRHREIFREWLGSHQGLMFKVVRAYGRTSDEQEDLFQEMSIQIWRSVPQFKQNSAVSTWIYRICLNTALNWKRKEKRHQEGRNSISEMENVLRESTVEHDDRLDWLYEEISQLPALDKSLTLLLLDGYSYKDMSTILGLSESNVGVRINRIKKRLIARSEKVRG